MVFSKDLPNPGDKGVACTLLMACMKFKMPEMNQRNHCQPKDLGLENSENMQPVCTTEKSKSPCRREQEARVMGYCIRRVGVSTTDLVSQPVCKAASLNCENENGME